MAKVTSATLRILTLLGLSLAVSCGGGKPAEKAEKKDSSSLLDEPLGDSVKKKKKSASLDSVMLVLPSTPEEMSKQIDGDTDLDWKGAKFRKFVGKKFIESGEEYWDGKSDTAMRIAVDSDDGWLYFAVEVKDDQIVDTPKDGEPIDSVVFTLRDPALDSLERSLPSGVGLESYVDAVSTFAVLTDGRVVADPDIEEFVEAATTEKKNGYILEVAVKIEAFSEVSDLPMERVAFRVDVLDGDEVDRPGLQTVFSSVPSSFETEKRFAKIDVDGLLPHAKLKGGPPRANAIGRWKFDGDVWSFASFEVVPKLWVTLEDAATFEEALLEDDVLSSVCNTARKDIKLIEAYQSRGGNFRVGLVVCGQRAVKGKCSSKAKTRVMFVKLEPDDDSWVVGESFNVFEKPLGQCTNRSIAKKPYYSDFSLFPLDMMGGAFWLVGWTRGEFEREYENEQFGVTVLNTKTDEPRVGLFVTDAHEADGQVRTYTKTNTYFGLVDKDDFIDVCQVEFVNEQYCSSFKRGCRTHERGKTVLTHAHMWNKSEKKFEKYMLSKHQGCRSKFGFKDRKAYLILQLNDRIGLLPSPEVAKDDYQLDLF